MSRQAKKENSVLVGSENVVVDYIAVTYGFGYKPNENIAEKYIGAAN